MADAIGTIINEIPPAEPVPVKAEAKKEDKPILLTRSHLESIAELLSQKQIYVLENNPARMINGKVTYYDEKLLLVTDRDLAHRFTYRMICGTFNAAAVILFELVDQELAKEVLKKKCLFGQVFEPSFIAMLKAAPNNPQLRAVILANVGKLPPESANTFELIKAWVEESHGTGVTGANVSAPPVNREAFRVSMLLRQRWHGQATYYSDAEGRALATVSSGDIDAVLAEGPHYNVVNLATLLQRRLERSVEGGNVAITASELTRTRTYNNHTLVTTGGSTFSLSESRTVLEQQLLDYLRSRLTPEQLAARGIR